LTFYCRLVLLGQFFTLKLQGEEMNQCPNCGAILSNVFSATNGVAGHEHVYADPLWGYECYACQAKFSLEEFENLEKQKRSAWWDYWENICSIFRIPYFIFIVIGSIILSRSIWAGVLMSAVIVLVVSFLILDFKKVFKRKRRKK
jgi:hypothetical protein